MDLAAVVLDLLGCFALGRRVGEHLGHLGLGQSMLAGDRCRGGGGRGLRDAGNGQRGGQDQETVRRQS